MKISTVKIPMIVFSFRVHFLCDDFCLRNDSFRYFFLSHLTDCQEKKTSELS